MIGHQARINTSLFHLNGGVAPSPIQPRLP